MARSHDRFTHTSSQLRTSLRTGTTPVDRQTEENAPKSKTKRITAQNDSRVMIPSLCPTTTSEIGLHVTNNDSSRASACHRIVQVSN